jgi:hypothetical protein
MFLKPSLSEVSVIYTLPFSRTVWISYALLVATLTIGLVFAVRTERRLQPSERHHPVRWSGAALNSLGIVCQQGNLQVSFLSCPTEYPRGCRLIMRQSCRALG